jgi:cellulose synthase/poly-beta-1,6-N-acetylglucosamine synthase-like glycosyltransferase
VSAVVVFWIAAAVVAYSTAGYPFLLWLLSRIVQRPHRREQIWPMVSVIIPVHQQAQILERKLQNTLALEYPPEKRQIIVVSDGEDRETMEYFESSPHQGVEFISMSERRGKHYAQRAAYEQATGEILVFTDAAIQLDSKALVNMVCNFADPAVGCVSSEDRVLASPETKVAEGSYVDFEMWLRRMEGNIWSLVSASGSFFAARREACEVWHGELSSDFFVALHVAQAGKRSVVDPNCLAWYGVSLDQGAEFQRKVRTIVHGLDVLFSHLHLLSPLTYGLFAWQLFSHKLCRWIVPFALISLLSANVALRNQPFYRVILYLQVAFYAAAMLAFVYEGMARFKPLKIARFFLLGNVAALVAWVRFFSGDKYVTWTPTRRP